MGMKCQWCKYLLFIVLIYVIHNSNLRYTTQCVNFHKYCKYFYIIFVSVRAINICNKCYLGSAAAVETLQWEPHNLEKKAHVVYIYIYTQGFEWRQASCGFGNSPWVREEYFGRRSREVHIYIHYTRYIYIYMCVCVWTGLSELNWMRRFELWR